VPVLLRDAILLILLGLAVRIFAPEFLCSLVRRQPLFCALIMLLYPLLLYVPRTCCIAPSSFSGTSLFLAVDGHDCGQQLGL